MPRRAHPLTAFCHWPRQLGAALVLLVAVHALLPGLHQLVAHGLYRAAGGAAFTTLVQHGDLTTSASAGDREDEAGCPICHQLQASGDIVPPMPPAGDGVSSNARVGDLGWLVHHIRGRPEIRGNSARGPPPA